MAHNRHKFIIINRTSPAASLPKECVYYIGISIDLINVRPLDGYSVSRAQQSSVNPRDPRDLYRS